MYLISPAMDTIVASGAAMLLIGLLVISMRSRKMGTRTPYTFYAYPNGVANRAAARSYPGFTLLQPSAPSRASSSVKRNGTKKGSAASAKSGKWENSSARLINPLDFQAIPVSPKAPKEPVSPLAGEFQPIVAKETPAAEAALLVPEAVTIPVNASAAMVLTPVPEPPEFVVETPAQALPRAMDEFPANFTTTHGSFERTPEPEQGIEISRAADQPARMDVLSFHGLKQQPFDVTPDPEFLYFSPSHYEALTSLTHGIENFRGFMALVAEPGMGKTTLLNKLMEELGDSARVVFLFQTQCTSSQLIGFILNELEIDHSDMDIVAMHKALNNALMGEMLLGRRFVLVVDEAQNLQDSVLETIRLLSDFETTHSKLIQIVLAGQPQLAETLMRPNLAQLCQRLAAVSSLKPMSVAETAEYIEHRLRTAGWRGQPIFTPDALTAIAETSKGVPRSINNICFNALQLAFSQGQETIDSSTVRKVAAQLNVASLVRRCQHDSDTRQPVAPLDRASTALLARALIAALSGDARLNANLEVPTKTKPTSGVLVSGTVTDMVRSQSWGKRDEYRIQVSLERDPDAGVAAADRYYCCNLYIDDEQAATLRSGKPVRIRIEQD